MQMKRFLSPLSRERKKERHLSNNELFNFSPLAGLPSLPFPFRVNQGRYRRPWWKNSAVCDVDEPRYHCYNHTPTQIKIPCQRTPLSKRGRGQGRPRVGHFRPNWPGGEARQQGRHLHDPPTKIYLDVSLNDDRILRPDNKKPRVSPEITRETY